MPADRNNHDGYVHVHGAREHNLKNVSLKIPRDALVVFTGVSGSGKSSLAFGTLYGEAQRRYLESVAPYARRLFHQTRHPARSMPSTACPPPSRCSSSAARSTTTRSSVGSVTTLSNLLRMLYSRAGDYPRGQPIIYAEGFLAEHAGGGVPHLSRPRSGVRRDRTIDGAGRFQDDPRACDRGLAGWRGVGRIRRDILVSMGIDVDQARGGSCRRRRATGFSVTRRAASSTRSIPPTRPPRRRAALKRKEPPNYMGTFTGAEKYVLQTFSTTESASMKKRVAQYMESAECPTCHGKRLQTAALSVKFAGLDIAELSSLPLKKLAETVAPFAMVGAPALKKFAAEHPEKAIVTQRIAEDLAARSAVLLELGLGYLTIDRSTPTLSPGELQRLRLATQVRSNLFGVVYVLDEPSAGLHPADTEALLRSLDRLKESGNSLFVVEHEIDVIEKADWIVDVGPAAGEQGGEILYSGPLAGLKDVEASSTRRFLFGNHHLPPRTPRPATQWVKLRGVTRNNLDKLDAQIPLGLFTSVTGVSGSGKSTLISQVLVELIARELGQHAPLEEDETDPLEADAPATTGGHIAGGLGPVRRLVRVDQKPIGRTPRSNLATYTGLFDSVRKLFAATKLAKQRHYDAGRFSFNVAKGRCEHCQGEGFVFVELLFLPSVYAPCPVCHGSRYNAKTLEVQYGGKNIAEVLGLTVDAAHDFFGGETALQRQFEILRQVGLGYIRLGQPATELSGGEAQRIKLATELQRAQRGDAIYILDEPTTGLHPQDVEKLMTQLDGLVDAGNTVVVVEHDMRVVSGSDWVIDIGPGAGDEGGQIVFAGTPTDLRRSAASRTAPFLDRFMTQMGS